MAQHRSNAIPGTLESVSGYPDHLMVYQIPASQYWYMRGSFAGRRVVKSTKTKNHSTALSLAREWYGQMMGKLALGQPLTKASDFKRAADALLVDEKERVRSGERKQSLVDDFEYVLNKDLLPFFQSVPLPNIDKAKISEYLAHVGKRNLSSRTKKNHLLHLRKVLLKAEDLKLIDRLPTFPKISLKQTPREWFTDEQYKKLLETIKKAIEKKVVVRGVPVTQHLLDLVEFMTGSFLRATDLKNLQHKHITYVTKDGRQYLRIMATGKVTPSPVISTTHAAHIYLYRLKSDSNQNMEDFVFFPQYGRDHAMSVMAKLFANVLKEAGLYNAGGPKHTRSLTSLRHTSIMRQLLHGELPLAVLARNCRTSITMIEKFYGSHVEAELGVTLMHQDRVTDPTDDLFQLDHFADSSTG